MSTPEQPVLSVLSTIQTLSAFLDFRPNARYAPARIKGPGNHGKHNDDGKRPERTRPEPLA